MKRLSRNQVIDQIEAASARDDHKAAQRLYIENRIGKDAFDKAWAAGQNLKRLVAEQKKGKLSG